MISKELVMDYLEGAEENHRKPQSAELVSWPRFEQHSSQMQVKNATATPIGSTPS
jgi:hypothetical protein